MIPPNAPRETQDEAAVDSGEDSPWYVSVDPVRRYATLTFLRGSLVSLAITVGAGVLAVLFYIPGAASFLVRPGLSFAALRPIHTTFASAWIFLGGIAVVHHYLQDHGGATTSAERRRLLVQVSLWGLTGMGILVTLAMGISSGREYMGFHPAFSAAILLGWLLFAWNFFRAVGRRFWGRPVYVTMWGVGALLFIYTFLEQHVWLFKGVFNSPIVDLRLQWKATGTLVGSFNLLVYGTLYYVGEKLSGDKDYAYSKMAYALFGVGLLNSFTNFAHHTYHVPQSEVVKWISFIVSMTEALILIRIISDIARMSSRRKGDPFNSTRCFIVAAKWWTCAMLFTSLLLSVPPLNALVHGTHVVTAHAMGTEIGIDSMVLFAAVSWILSEVLTRRTGADAVLHSPRMRFLIVGLNVMAGALIVWLHISGIIVGYTRYQLLPPPEWLQSCNYYVFASAGCGTALFLFALVATWLRIAFGRNGRLTSPV